MILYRPVDINLIKTKFNFLIKELDDGDIKLLNELLVRLHPKLKINGKDVYMNGRNIKFMNENNEPTIFQSNKRWTIEIAIQGYKTSSSGQVSPIWKINEATII